MRLENPDIHAELPSPITHMALQCQLGRAISKIPGVAAGILSPAHADIIQQETEKWFASFPPAYRITDPDLQWEKEYRYVALQRCQLHVVGSLRERAVDRSLKLMDASRRLFECIFPATADFHFAIFLIFDTAAFLCSAIIHDNNRSLPQRGKVVEAIGLGVGMMERLRQLTKNGAICYAILSKLVANLSLSSEERIAFQSSFPGDSGIRPESSEAQNYWGISSPGNISTSNAVSSLETFPTGTDTPSLLNLPVTEMEQFQTTDLSDLANMDVGELGQIWDWGTLDLNL
ncbi:hypothetical protein VTN00DRAFT_5737 [Thermoascus crustaceus]|uniref:uncharacterized protein n=1 Tax=Thermoascus crustaceus TaxID=5088 RepID=UPI0037435CEE